MSAATLLAAQADRVSLTSQTRIIAAALAILFMLLILELIRRDRLQERYSVIWFVAGLAMLAGAAFPGLLKFVADLMGVRDTNVALFSIVLLLLLGLALNFSVIMSRQAAQITRLAQERAIERAREQAAREAREDEQPKSNSRAGALLPIAYEALARAARRRRRWSAPTSSSPPPAARASRRPSTGSAGGRPCAAPWPAASARSGRSLSTSSPPRPTSWVPEIGDPLLEEALERFPLVVELTERALPNHATDLIPLAKDLRRRGARIALDDVGTDPARSP